jgi:hypothetical protein
MEEYLVYYLISAHPFDTMRFFFTVCFFDIFSVFILISDYFKIMGFLLHGFWYCEEKYWIK